MAVPRRDLDRPRLEEIVSHGLVEGAHAQTGERLERPPRRTVRVSP